MSALTPYHDPTVPAVVIERYKLAYLMQFFVQHKQRFKFPRVRLQDLYKLLETPDTRPLAYLIVQILRFLKVPNATIITVDKALNIFASEKRTSTRICIHQLRANRQISELSPESKAKLLENLIETVYDELPDFNFAPNGFNSGNSSNGANSHSFCGGNKSLNDIKQEESTDDSMNELAIKAGSDSRGSSYVYLDDLRLYREKPQSSLSTQWDVVVGPTIDQWHNFIKSLGNTDEEGDLRAFLQDHLLEVVCTSLDSGELTQDNPELNTTYLLNREQAEFNGSADYCSVNTNKLSNCSNNLYDINDPCGGGGSINGDMTCMDSSGAAVSIKQEMPDTPESYSGSSYINTNMVQQNQQLIPRSNSYPGSQIPMASPLYGSVSSPAQSAHGGPLTPSGDSNQMKTSPRIAASQNRDQRVDNSNIPMSYSQPHQNMYQPMPEGMIRYQAPHRFPCPTNAPMVMIGNNPAAPQAAPSQVMVFTTQMANDAAVEHSRHRTPIYQFHNNHPMVTDFIQQQCTPNRLIGLQKPFENLTQKQLENRKNKMAKLEQIQSTLSKTKAQSSSNPPIVTQSSTAPSITTAVSSEMHPRPPSASNQQPATGPQMCQASSGLDVSKPGLDNVMQDPCQSVTSNSTSIMTETGVAGQCHQFSNEQMQSQFHFSSSAQMSSAEQQMMMAGDGNNPPTSEAALRQWELLRLEYMREKQTHDVMNNRFPSGDMGPYTNSNGPGNQPMMPNTLPVGSNMMVGHRPNIIRQQFSPHPIPMEPSPGPMYQTAAGVKRPYQMIGAPPPPGYHAHPLYHNHHDQIANQRAMIMQQQQQQQQQPRCPPICDPSWNMMHANYPHMGPHHHQMHQNFQNMYPHHRGPTPPTALGITNGPMSTGQNLSSNSSTTTATSTSSKSKSKKRKSTAKSTASVTNPSTTITTSASMSSNSNSSLAHLPIDVKQPLPSSNMCSEVHNQRFAAPLAAGIGPHDDTNSISRTMSNFQDPVINGAIANRVSLSETQILSAQIKHDLISPNKASFSPINEMKSIGSLNSSSNLNPSMSSNNNFSSNQSNSATPYCSSSINSPSQNLTSASLASLARLSSQMSGGSDSPLFNSLQSQPTTHCSSSSNPLPSKMSSNNLIHSVPGQQLQDPQMPLHQMSQTPGNSPYHSQYSSYRNPSAATLAQSQQQQQSQHNNNAMIQQQEIQNRQQKSNQSSMMNLQSNPQANNFMPTHMSQGQVQQSQHTPFQGSHEMMFTPYQSYPNQQMPINNNNPGNNPNNSSTSNNSSIMPGVPIQPGQQQPPSIMVNNTFVNAQLNVQQMNYQHLAAPNVNAQMQIQQQHQSLQPATLMNLETPSKHPTELSSSNPSVPVNQTMNNASNDLSINQSNNNNMGLNIPAGNGAQAVSTGFMNSSVVQIQSKTPHTIQYLPAEPVPTVMTNVTGNSNPHQMDMPAPQSKYSNIATPSFELDELLTSQHKQMIFQPQNHELSTGIMNNMHPNNAMMMGQQQMESQHYRFQQHQQQIRLRAGAPGAMMPHQGATMIMRQGQTQQQQQQLVLQQSFAGGGGGGGVLLEQQMKQQQIQRLMMVNSSQMCQQQQQQQHMMMAGPLPPGAGHGHYGNMEGGQDQHMYHQQQFIALQQQQQQQQQIRQQQAQQGHHFG